MAGIASTRFGKSTAHPGPLLLIDNYDSFVFNLDHCFRRCGLTPIVRRNDAVSIDEVGDLNPAAIVISPGPGWPDRAGISTELVRRFAGTTPILGVCLGHQAIAEAFGGTNRRSGMPMHGKSSMIEHDGRTIFSDLPSPFRAMRYHSLVVDRPTLPQCLEVTAWTADGTIMGLRHRTYPIEGVQFHPESILTDHGQQLIVSFLTACSPA